MRAPLIGLAAVLLLVVCMATRASAAPATFLMDTVKASASGGAGAKAKVFVSGPSDADYYEGSRETETIRVGTPVYCGGAESYMFNELVCDQEFTAKQHGGDYDKEAQGFGNAIGNTAIAGYCYILTDDEDFPIPGNPNVVVSGMFTLTCQLQDTCGLPHVHGELTINAQGFTYEVYNTYMLYDPFDVYPASGTCSRRRRDTGKQIDNMQKTAARQAEKQAAREAKQKAKKEARQARKDKMAAAGPKSASAVKTAAYYGDDSVHVTVPAPLPETVYNGDLRMYTGYMTVTSRTGKSPYREGWLEWLWPEGSWGSGPSSEIANPIGPITNPFTITMEFWKEKKGYYEKPYGKEKEEEKHY